jgi:hypothetical protein
MKRHNFKRGEKIRLINLKDEDLSNFNVAIGQVFTIEDFTFPAERIILREINFLIGFYPECFISIPPEFENYLESQLREAINLIDI